MFMQASCLICEIQVGMGYTWHCWQPVGFFMYVCHWEKQSLLAEIHCSILQPPQGKSVR